MDSTITIVGNLTRDPELRFTPSGAAVCGFGVAVNRRWQQNNEWQEAVSFIDVTCWGTLAENVSASLDKGARVMVMGRIEQENWENDNGEKRSKLKIVADICGPDLRWASCQVNKNERSDNSGSQPQAARPTQPKPTPAAPAPNPYAQGEEPF